uniref:Rab-GAP TBC domain-containing protein n=1 Tax=Macrostomum lignano TaxID=282301 RepID=A0A1I8H8F2_9PLAT
SLTKASPQHSDQGSEIGTDFNYDSLLEESPSKSRQQQQQTKPTKPSPPQQVLVAVLSCRRASRLQGETARRSPETGRVAAAVLKPAALVERPLLVSRVKKSDAGDSDIRHEMEDLQKQNSALKEVLRKRDTLIAELDLKLSRALRFNVTRAGPPRFKSESAMLDWIKEKSDNLRHLEEQCRVLQNNNRFVNSEVRRITSLRHMEQEKFRNQDKLFREHKLQLENWKRDYLFLLQSCITVPTGDVSDGIELNLYGGGRHKERLRELLEEARVVNPRLPTFESLVSPDGHVDSYGFRHSQESESMQLHYISRQLHEHYATTLDRYDEHQRHWKSFIASNRSFTKTTELKSLIRGGIPRMYRSAVWRELIHAQVQEIRSVRGQQYYSGLVQRATESDIVAKHRKQISLDLMRTMPGNVRFESSDSEGIQKLQEILQAFCLHNPSVGYCQGMNFIAGMGLLFLSKEDAFWLLVAVTECYFHPLYFTGSLLGAQADQLVLKDLIRRQMPNLHEHISNLDIDVGTVTLNWFLAIYFDALPFETLLRLWDCFLLEGPKVLFRFALAVLKSSEAALLRQTDTIGLWRHLKAAARLAFDVDGLARTAFAAGADAGVPSRRELDARRGVYIAALAEADERRKRLRRRALQDEEEEAEEDEAAVDRGDMESPNQPLVSSGLSSPDGSVWICYGDSGRSQVCRLRIEDNLMFSLGVEIESQVSCSYSLDSCQVVLLGTLGMFIAALDAGS